MRAYLLFFVITLSPWLALADPQCSLPLSASQSAAVTTPESVTASVAQASRPIMQAAQHGPATTVLSADGTGRTVLDHVVAAGAHVTDVGVSHGLRTVIARSDG